MGSCSYLTSYPRNLHQLIIFNFILCNSLLLPNRTFIMMSSSSLKSARPILPAQPPPQLQTQKLTPDGGIVKFVLRPGYSVPSLSEASSSSSAVTVTSDPTELNAREKSDGMVKESSENRLTDGSKEWPKGTNVKIVFSVYTAPFKKIEENDMEQLMKSLGKLKIGNSAESEEGKAEDIDSDDIKDRDISDSQHNHDGVTEEECCSHHHHHRHHHHHHNDNSSHSQQESKTQPIDADADDEDLPQLPPNILVSPTGHLFTFAPSQKKLISTTKPDTHEHRHDDNHDHEHDHAHIDNKDTTTEPFSLRIGKKFAFQALETAVKSMNVGEISRFLICPEYSDGFIQLETILRREKQEKQSSTTHSHARSCCGSALSTSLDPDLSSTLNQPLELEVELLSVEPPGTFVPEIWEMTLPEKYKEVVETQEKGRKLCRDQHWEKAVELYKRGITLVDSILISPTFVEIEKEATESSTNPSSLIDSNTQEHTNISPSLVHSLNLSFRLNYTLSLLALPQPDYQGVINQCTYILTKLDSQNKKALYRRGKSYLRVGRDLDLARKDLEMLEKLGMDDDFGVKQEWKILEDKEKKVREKEKKMFKGLFN
ncbi:hypothetical protein BKA69DRAFT_248273 [Paraphysoderma sedebokerense]|nr:hypothetical protein BKA69DRAFT_248273 [Paraphysoderma sedebokerense]